MRIKIFILALFISLNLWAQKEGFVIRGYIPGMPDGVKVTLMEKEGKRSTKAETIVKDERFELKGRVESPQAFMLITNNMEIQTKNPGMKIKWTYTDLFVENTEISITSGAYSELDSKSKLQVKGGQAHQDYEEFMNMKGSNREWDFIHSHPRSVVSVMLANGLLERGYNLTKEQVETLENNIIGCPCDTARYNEFKKRVALAKQTTVGAALLDLDLTDIDNRQVQLVDVVPKGKYVLIAALCMLIYIAIRFDFNSGAAAVLGLVHDVLIMLSFMVILRSFVQMNSSFIAAMLTIVGYSINNTIIIFDRIRENARKMPSSTPRVDVVNRSIKECLGRTINTTLTTLVTIVSLYIFGVSSIREFALPIIVGIISGVYSANMINGYVWAFLEEKKRAKKAAKA